MEGAALPTWAAGADCRELRVSRLDGLQGFAVRDLAASRAARRAAHGDKAEGTPRPLYQPWAARVDDKAARVKGVASAPALRSAASDPVQAVLCSRDSEAMERRLREECSGKVAAWWSRVNKLDEELALGQEAALHARMARVASALAASASSPALRGHKAPAAALSDATHFVRQAWSAAGQPSAAPPASSPPRSASTSASPSSPAPSQSPASAGAPLPPSATSAANGPVKHWAAASAAAAAAAAAAATAGTPVEDATPKSVGSDGAPIFKRDSATPFQLVQSSDRAFRSPSAPLSFSPYRPDSAGKAAALVRPATAKPLSAHVQRLADALLVEKARLKLARAGFSTPHRVLEHALSVPRVEPSERPSERFLPQPWRLLARHPDDAGAAGSARGKGAKKKGAKKGAKAKKKKSKGK